MDSKEYQQRCIEVNKLDYKKNQYILRISNFVNIFLYLLKVLKNYFQPARFKNYGCFVAPF